MVRGWPFEIGQTVQRREIHELFGGQRQSGIVTPASTTDIFVFTDPDSGAAYGYDKFEGQREDGSYSYTGQGQTGDQVFQSGNKAIRDAASLGRIIRLFRTKGTYATYVGEFTTADPSHSIKRILDKSGEERNGIVFNLLPVRADMTSLPAYGGSQPSSPVEHDWREPSSTDIEFELEESVFYLQTKNISREEFRLQASFGNWLRRRNLNPKRLRLPADEVTIEPDFYVPEPKQWIVEAKRSQSRKYVREAIGQVLDYIHVASSHGVAAQPVILLPGRPSPSLRDLLQRLEIILIVPSGDGDFEVVEP